MLSSPARHIRLTRRALSFISGRVRGVVDVHGGAVCVGVGAKGGVCEYFR